MRTGDVKVLFVSVAVAVFFVASEVLSTLPSPRLVRAVAGVARSDKLFAATSLAAIAVELYRYGWSKFTHGDS